VMHNIGREGYITDFLLFVGHYLGMDVHDCSTVSLDRPLQPGVVSNYDPFFLGTDEMKFYWDYYFNFFHCCAKCFFVHFSVPLS
jgi:hypothetical protein